MGILSKRRKIPEVSYLDAAHGKTKQSTLPSDLRTLYKLDPAYVETVVRQVYGGENSDQRAQRQTRGMYVSASAPGGIAIDRVVSLRTRSDPMTLYVHGCIHCVHVIAI